MPAPAAAPTLALVGSRADKVADAVAMVVRLHEAANAEAGLPPVSAAFALDCRKRWEESWRLREWLVAQHDELVARASRVPRACEAIVRMKPAFVREDGPLVRWERFVERCRAEVGLRKAEASLLRTAANYLHDAGELIALDRGRAAEVVVLTPTWLCATLVGELFARRPPPQACAQAAAHGARDCSDRGGDQAAPRREWRARRGRGDARRRAAVRARRVLPHFRRAAAGAATGGGADQSHRAGAVL